VIGILALMFKTCEEKGPTELPPVTFK